MRFISKKSTAPALQHSHVSQTTSQRKDERRKIIQNTHVLARATKQAGVAGPLPYEGRTFERLFFRNLIFSDAWMAQPAPWKT